MSWLIHEWRLLTRSRLSQVAVLLILGLTTVAVWAGLHEVDRQQQTIARLAALQEQELQALADQYGNSGGAGRPAYYTFHNTWDAPSEAAFLALGMRDTAPYVLRVRALGLQAQLYEGEVFNPELALPGRFDFTFVLIYLAPLFVIALLHDLVSNERQSDRLKLLVSLPEGGRVWRRRLLLRYGLMFACLAVPAMIGAIVAGTTFADMGMVLAVVASYLAFWAGLALLVAARGWRSGANATALMGVWVLLTLVLPALANAALVRAIPVHQGVDLMLAQRQAVHGAWEVPREETMQRFYTSHPRWKNTPPLPPGFHWKWYFAFHQVGDESVSDHVQAYRTGLLARQSWTDRIGWVLPSAGAQAALHRIASTDLPAQLAYQDRIAAFHGQIREFYYSYLFNERPFGSADYEAQPVFQPHAQAANPITVNALVLLVLCWLIAGVGLWRVGASRSL